jgi:biofilm PGA synthesis N-glycosyltransferase PgaC
MIYEKPQLPAFFVFIDLILPLIDFFYTFAFIPGIFLALTGRFYIVGPLTLLVFPIVFLIVLTMYIKEKSVFDLLGLKVRKNILGVVMYIFIYQLILSPISLIGYAQEVFGVAKKW